MSAATTMAVKRVQSVLDLAAKLETDSDKPTRLVEQNCKACYYFSSIAGQAFTDQQCACCGTLESYSSTNTDALCMACAKGGDLCKHCGGDISMRPGRRKWPANSTPNVAQGEEI